MQRVGRSGGLAWGLRSEFLTSFQMMDACTIVPGHARRSEAPAVVLKHEHVFKLLYLAVLLKLRLLEPTSRICDSVVWSRVRDLPF